MAITLSQNWLKLNSSDENIVQHRPFDFLMSGFQISRDLHSQRNIVLLSSSSQDSGPSLRCPKKSESLASLNSTTGPDRDFEGVGGWKISDNSDNEAIWMKINSRLELPIQNCDRRRRHHRSSTNGNQRNTWNQEAIRMNLVNNCVKTPTAVNFAHNQEGYFES